MRRLSCALFVVVVLLVGVPAGASAQSYNPITPTKAGETITLTGKNLTVQEVVDIARHGAKVRVSAAHRQSSADNLELVLEGARQEVPIYGFNRGGGAEREVVIFEGDPLAPETAELLVQRRYDGFRLTGVHGGGEQHTGLGPEVADEEVVRAQMAVTLNRMRYSGMNPRAGRSADRHAQRADCAGRSVPWHRWRGRPGAGCLGQSRDGRSRRGPFAGAADVCPPGADDHGTAAAREDGELDRRLCGLGGHNSYTDGQAALLVHDAKQTLDWGDLVFAMSMLGLNSSVNPLTAVPQNIRAFPFVNWQARRLLNILRGSYLFELELDPNDPEDTHGQRLLQDPLSYRDYSQRNGSAWEAYSRLKKNLLIEINSGSSNPITKVGTHPTDSWELNTPWIKRYYVEPAGNTEGGFILGSANFDNTPLNDSMEQFTLALAQSYVGNAGAHTAHLRPVLHGGPNGGFVWIPGGLPGGRAVQRPPRRLVRDVGHSRGAEVARQSGARRGQLDRARNPGCAGTRTCEGRKGAAGRRQRPIPHLAKSCCRRRSGWTTGAFSRRAGRSARHRRLPGRHGGSCRPAGRTRTSGS